MAQSIAPATSAALQEWNRTLDQMQRDGQLLLSRTEDDPQVAGRRHERLRQQHRGVPVWGTAVNRQLAGSEVLSVFGTVYSEIDLPPTTARLSAQQARGVIANLSGSDTRGIKVPELVVLPKPDGGFALTYTAQAWSDEGPMVYFIDASTGETVWSYRNFQTQSTVYTGRGVISDTKKVSLRTSGSGAVADDMLRPPSLKTYDMRFNLARIKSVLNGFAVLGTSDLATAASDPWTDGASVDAHTYAGWTYDYYFKRHGRRGIDNKNLPVTSVVHPANRDTILSASANDQGQFYLNAFWFNDFMVYGDGAPPTLAVNAQGTRITYFAGSLDIVGHELTHGVTEYSSGLIYLNESGALNESFSDMMGTSIEFYFQNAHHTANYILGEDLVTVQAPGWNRSLADPRAFNNPDHYALRFIGTADNGGVHSNSGISNNAFYLAIEGGNNRTSGLAVTGVGAANREQIEKVFYRAFTQLMGPSSTFAVARAATIQAARDLYGANSAAERAVMQAWTAVGVN